MTVFFYFCIINGCSRVTIRLRGTATESDAFGQITELVAPVANELDLYKAQNGDKVRSELRIVEVDLLKWLTKKANSQSEPTP